VKYPVAERIGRLSVTAQREPGLKGDTTQNNNDLQVLEQRDFPLKIGSASGEFFGERLVVRRRAVGGRGDPGVAKDQSVAGVDTGRLRRKPGAVERTIKEVTRFIAGKHPAGAICSVRARGEAENQQARLGVTERRNRTSPIVPVEIRSALSRCDLHAVRAQSRALGAT